MFEKISEYRKNTIWITDGIQNKIIKKNDCIPVNWKHGKTQKINIQKISEYRKNAKFIHNGIKTKVIKDNEKLPDGWNYGRLINYKITNGLKNKTVTQFELQSYLNDGWFRGWLD